jgi:glycosyltransferase involved in cell wall biosynthesis
MNIAFDAKRAYQNGTGLGHYSRTLISSLAKWYPNNQYYLCAPKLTSRFDAARFSNMHTITPSGFLSRTFKAIWRGNLVLEDLIKNNIDLYHGLSHEIPVGIYRTKIKSVVTIHDLIHERYPEMYNWMDVKIYRHKFSYACRHADRVIAISQQTKDDIVSFYKIPEEKIDICYQSCNPMFENHLPEDELLRVKEKYNLPGKFFLYVGSIIERKNLLNICKALKHLKDSLQVPLVVIGDGSVYKQKVLDYLKENNIENRVIFLSDHPSAKLPEYINATDFPAIYQQAMAMIYPSVFEGFGIPVLEALWSRIPVITSNISCLPETGGDAALLVDPYNPIEIAEAMQKVHFDRALVSDMIKKGLIHAQKFTPEKCAADVMQLYLRLV